MKRAEKKKYTRHFGRASGNLEMVLFGLRGSSLRIHPFEERLQGLIKEVDTVFSLFVEYYPEDKEGKN